MPNLFFVTVAIGIFSATSLTAKAQPSVNLERLNSTAQSNPTRKFIESIEINTTTSPLNASEVSGAENNKVEEVSAIENCNSLQFKYAMLLDIDVENLSNITLLSEIEKWWATNYRYGGTTKKGIDCSAYTGTLLASVYGITAPRTSREQYAESEKIDKENLKQGDLVFFNTSSRKRGGVNHVGVYLGNGYFTHAGTSTGVTISNLSDSYWSSRYINGGRISTSVTEED